MQWSTNRPVYVSFHVKPLVKFTLEIDLNGKVLCKINGWFWYLQPLVTLWQESVLLIKSCASWFWLESFPLLKSTLNIFFWRLICLGTFYFFLFYDYTYSLSLSLCIGYFHMPNIEAITLVVNSGLHLKRGDMNLLLKNTQLYICRGGWERYYSAAFVVLAYQNHISMWFLLCVIYNGMHFNLTVHFLQKSSSSSELIKRYQAFESACSGKKISNIYIFKLSIVS